MAKTKTAFFCQNCGMQSPKWIGKCASCGEWNTYVEEVIEKETKTTTDWKIKIKQNGHASSPIAISDIQFTHERRLVSSDDELNRVLGGGIVPGSLILVGGEPGIGKSTLLLQLSLNLTNQKTLYVTGEESIQQIKMRSERIGIKNDNCFILAETSTQNIFKEIEKLAPDMLIVDSIQTLHSQNIDSPAGSISQIRQCAAELQRYAKETQTPVFLIGHITKDGAIAGPKVLEHIVDTVLQFEGDRHYAYRILRTVKNRYGPSPELGIYEMQSAGMKEVKNPSEILITQRDEPLSGITIAATIEGMRPMLIETQALVSPAVYGTPQRSTTGFDLRRLNMLLAVLEKRCGFRFGMKDVFLNIAGGIKVEDPAIDLAVATALISSFEDKPISANICFAGEVGLSGEIRAVNRIEQRITEADRLGFEKTFISKYGQKAISKSNYQLEIVSVKKVSDIVGLLF